MFLLFSKPKQGVHKYRTLYMSRVELFFMLCFCSFISFKTKYSFAKVLFNYLLAGKIFHFLFLKQK